MDNTYSYSAVFCNKEHRFSEVEQLYLFRKYLFIDECGWRLPECNGQERDQFDTSTSIYCIIYQRDDIVATFRAIRTDFPYLAKSVFPDLSSEYPYPVQTNIWEISRFGVRPCENQAEVSQINYALMFYFAHHVGADSLVAVTDLMHERLLRLLGIHTRRFGPPQIIGTDAAGKPLKVVAGEIPLAQQNKRNIRHLISTLHNVDITDASQIFGRQSISA